MRWVDVDTEGLARKLGEVWDQMLTRPRRRDIRCVTTVTSSSTEYEMSWVGSKGAETKSLNLFAMGASAPTSQKLPGPPPKDCFWGNWVLCCPFVQGPYAAKLAAFSRV